MRGRLLVASFIALAASALVACAARPVFPPPGAPPGATVAPRPAPQPPYAPPARQFRLGPAATALVAQAHAQAKSGEYPAAGATLERALRIEPDDPLIWIELGRLQLDQHDPGQADGMGRKALALAEADPSAQAAAYRLIADALRAQGRNPEAVDADQHAASLAPR
jgi:tetratricopeptide (TPR) repeat protein